MTKICRTCHQEQDMASYHRRLRPDGEYAHHGECKKCMNARWKRNHGKQSPEYWQSYYQRNKVSRLAKQREYYYRNRERISEYYKQRRKQNPRVVRDEDLRGIYGITLDYYEALAAKQDGKCAICRRIPTAGKGRQKLFVDHDHVTGRIRGLLCHNCNIGLGNFQENQTVLSRAMAYLASGS